MDVIRTVEGLRQMGHLGITAAAFGAPDEVMLLSTGPASHLAKPSMIARPPRCRAVLRQPRTMPSRETLSNPLEGEPAWSTAGPLEATVQRWEAGAWHDDQTLSTSNLADLMRELETSMLSPEPFVQQAEGWPLRPFLTGAFAYDLVQWTQPKSPPRARPHVEGAGR